MDPITLGIATAIGMMGGKALMEVRKHMLTYPSAPGKPYGYRWKDQRPPGLPPSARLTSTPEFGRQFLEQRLDAKGIHGVLRKALLSLARTESGYQLAIPAYNFDARIKEWGHEDPPDRYGTDVDGLRASGKQIITAWGMWGWNRDAWRLLPGQGLAFPWEANPYDEVDLPIDKYASLWREAKRAGADDLGAARYIRLWQRGQAYSKRFKSAAQQVGWGAAWNSAVSSENRNVINEHYAHDGIG